MSEYTNFKNANKVTGSDLTYLSQYETDAFNRRLKEYPHVLDLFRSFSGCLIENGLFRFHTPGSSILWTEITEGYFTGHKDLFHCFGFDWMGRQFASSRKDDTTYMFDPATGKVFELKQTLAGFLNEDLVDYRDDTLGVETFHALEHLFKSNITHDQCLGFKIPLFLGGEDELENFELEDMQLYWQLNYQLYCKVQSLPEGQLIKKITFE